MLVTRKGERDMKKVLVMLMVLCTVLGCMGFAVSPRYTYVDYVDTVLTINGSTVYTNCEVVASSDISRIQTYLTLEKKSGSSWTGIDSWSGTEYDSSGIFTGSTTVGSGTYRVKASIYAYTASGRYENVITYSNQVTK